MWYPATATEATASEPITLEEAKRQVNVYHDDEDDLFNGLISSARDHVEKYCGTRLATQTVAVKCDCFADMVRLPEGPVQSVSSVSYIDTTGATQTLSTDVYELRADGLEAAIVLKYGQQWPAIQPRSRITVTAVVGYSTAPAAIKHAILLWLADAYQQRENVGLDEWTALDSLLCNYRRGG